MPRKTRKIQSNTTVLKLGVPVYFASAKINRRALRGSAIAPFLRNSCAAPPIPNAVPRTTAINGGSENIALVSKFARRRS